MSRFLLKHWFLVALATEIVVGLTLGAKLSPDARDGVLSLLSDSIKTGIVVVVLFLMSVTLNGERLKTALVAPAPVLWAVFINIILLPLIAWPIARLQLIEDFTVGLLIAVTVPCTMATASVWTRRAGGNDAISLLVTVITNGFCFVYTPFWLRWLTSSNVQLNAAEMARNLAVVALLPIAAGQLLRYSRRCAEVADRWKSWLSNAAQIGVLVMIGGSALNAGGQLVGQTSTPSTSAIALVWGSCIALHLGALGIALWSSRFFQFAPDDCSAIAISASQKTLPIGMLIATSPVMYGHLEFAVFPMLMFHASQLFLDTPIADAFRRQHEARRQLQEDPIKEPPTDTTGSVDPEAPY
ncbi:MAG: bile acid:sodium symporter [Planctomycetaceae bacterium]